MSELFSGLKEANLLYKNGDLTKAKQSLQALLLENNNDYRIYFLLGLIYHKEGNFNKAINNYKKASQLNPNDMESFLNLSLVYNDLGKYKEGSDFYKMAYKVFDDTQKRNITNSSIDIDEMFSKQHSTIGDLYLRYNRLEEAELEYKKAINLNNANLSALLSLSELLYRLKRKKEAFKILYTLKKEHSKFFQARVKLGHLQYLEGNYGEAIEEWDEVLKEEENNVDAKMFKKMMYENAIIT